MPLVGWPSEFLAMRGGEGDEFAHVFRKAIVRLGSRESLLVGVNPRNQLQLRERLVLLL